MPFAATDQHGTAYPVPDFPGWEALGLEVPMEADHVLVMPFYDRHKTPETGNVEDVQRLVGKVPSQVGAGTMWCVYRPVKWVKLEDPEIAVQMGDVFCPAGQNDPAMGVLAEGNGWKDAVARGVKLGLYHAHGYTFWRKVPGRQERPIRLTGNPLFAKVAPLP